MVDKSDYKEISALLVAVMLLSFVSVLVGGGATSPLFGGGLYPGAPDYTVFLQDGRYYVKDKLNDINYSSTNKNTAIQYAINQLSYGRVYVYDMDPTTCTVTYKPGVIVEYDWSSNNNIRMYGMHTSGKEYYYEQDFNNSVYKIRSTDSSYPPTMVFSGGQINRAEAEVGAVSNPEGTKTQLTLHSLSGDTIVQLPAANYTGNDYASFRIQTGTPASAPYYANFSNPIDLVAFYDYGTTVFYAVNTAVTETPTEIFRINDNGYIRLSVPAAGIILTSPNGSHFCIQVGNDGVLATNPIA